MNQMKEKSSNYTFIITDRLRSRMKDYCWDKQLSLAALARKAIEEKLDGEGYTVDFCDKRVVEKPLSDYGGCI